MESIELIIPDTASRCDIVVAAGCLRDESLWSPLKQRQVALVTTEPLLEHYGRQVLDHLPDAIVIPIDDSERGKDMTTVNRIIDSLLQAKFNRDACLIGLGGGVITDITGFVAAIFLRGIDCYYAPTTLLGQVDAAVGGKTGVNHSRGKNLIGAFKQPRKIICDIETLRTLDQRDYVAGIAEIIKYALINDAAFFSWLQENIAALHEQHRETLISAVVHCIRAKTAIVEADEKESGKRALLNLGHTFAHAIENATAYGTWRHGEAVAMGLVAAAKLSEKILGFSPNDTASIIALLAAAKLPTQFPEDSAECIFDAMQYDKKIIDKKMQFVLMKSIGGACVTENVRKEEVIETIEAMRP